MKRCIFNEFIISNSNMINFAQSFNDYSSISSFLHEQIPTHFLIAKLKLLKCNPNFEILILIDWEAESTNRLNLFILVRNVGGRHQTTVPLSKRNFLMNKLFLNRFSKTYFSRCSYYLVCTFSTWILRRPKRVVKDFRLDIYDKSLKILNNTLIVTLFQDLDKIWLILLLKQTHYLLSVPNDFIMHFL